jgi:hypothetical protein
MFGWKKKDEEQTALISRRGSEADVSMRYGTKQEMDTSNKPAAAAATNPEPDKHDPDGQPPKSGAEPKESEVIYANKKRSSDDASAGTTRYLVLPVSPLLVLILT